MNGFTTIVQAMVDRKWKFKDCMLAEMRALLSDDREKLKGIDSTTKNALHKREAVSLALWQRLRVSDLQGELVFVGIVRKKYLLLSLQDAGVNLLPD